MTRANRFSLDREGPKAQKVQDEEGLPWRDWGQYLVGSHSKRGSGNTRRKRNVLPQRKPGRLEGT